MRTRVTKSTGNPARLLKGHLHAAAAVKRVNSNGNPRSAVAVWADALAVADGSAELARKITDLQNLAGEIRLTAEQRHPNQLLSVNVALGQFESGTLVVGQLSFQDYWTRIDGDHLINYLTAWSELFDGSDDLHLVVIDTNSLRTHMEALLEEVTAATDLPDELKSHVLTHLRSIIDYLVNGDTRTTGVFRLLLSSLAGKVLGDKEAAEQLAKSKAGRAIIAMAFAAAGIVGLPSAIDVLQGVVGGELPPPDPQVQILIHSDCHPEPLELDTGPEPKAIGPGSNGDSLTAGTSSEDSPG